MNGKKNRFYGKRCKLKDQNFTQFNFAQTHIDGTGQEKIIGTGMVRESKSNFIGTGSRTSPVPLGQTLLTDPKPSSGCIKEYSDDLHRLTNFSSYHFI